MSMEARNTEHSAKDDSEGGWLLTTKTEQVWRDFSTSIATSMRQAAQRANVPIIADEIAITSTRNMAIANAPVVHELGSPGRRQIMFVFLSFLETRCAQLFPTGFYTIEEIAELHSTHTGDTESTANLLVRFINSEGDTVAERLFVRKVMRMPASDAKAMMSPKFLAEARIEESAVTMERIIVLSSHDHYYRAGWEWWEWIYPDGPI